MMTQNINICSSPNIDSLLCLCTCFFLCLVFVVWQKSSYFNAQPIITTCGRHLRLVVFSLLCALQVPIINTMDLTVLGSNHYISVSSRFSSSKEKSMPPLYIQNQGQCWIYNSCTLCPFNKNY
jgi:hypothetical protein